MARLSSGEGICQLADELDTLRQLRFQRQPPHRKAITGSATLLGDSPKTASLPNRQYRLPRRGASCGRSTLEVKCQTTFVEPGVLGGFFRKRLANLRQPLPPGKCRHNPAARSPKWGASRSTSGSCHRRMHGPERACKTTRPGRRRDRNGRAMTERGRDWSVYPRPLERYAPRHERQSRSPRPE